MATATMPNPAAPPLTTDGPQPAIPLMSGPGGHTAAVGGADADLLAGSAAGLSRLGPLTDILAAAAVAGLCGRRGPLPAASPAEHTAQVMPELVADGGLLPARGRGLGAVVELIGRYAAGTVDLADPATAAHLQPPTLAVPSAVEAIVAALNASVDTWDSGPYAVAVERQLLRALADRIGLPADSDGVFTSGGTASNLHALLIARNAATPRGPGGKRPVVFCSTAAHYSIARAAEVLGMGADAVRTIPVDHQYRMRTDLLADALSALRSDEVPAAIVATAGTTDYGSIDPLTDCARLAREYGCRLHVDAAYGGGAIFSTRLRPLLNGLHAADSVTIDLHKIGWQPAPASILLVRDAADFTPHRVDYLNPADDGDAGYDGLLDRSVLATTRRADALKLAATFRAYGSDRLGALIEQCHELARYAQHRIQHEPQLELVAGATLTTVVFRHRGSDTLNAALRRRLLRTGTALIGRTTVPDRGVCLKLTLLNPLASTGDIDQLIDAIVTAGAAEHAA